MASILDEFPRGVGSRHLNQHELPFAAWTEDSAILASPALSYDPRNPGKKILLGALGSRLIGLEDDRHMITIAGSRSGKGVSMIIPNLLFYRGSMLVIDPKGELASITARRRAQGLHQKVYVLDPFERTADWVNPYKASFNPMTMLTLQNKNIVEDAGLIADALVVPSGGDVHWDESAKNFIEGVILHVATCPAYNDKRNLITVRHVLMNGTKITHAGKTEEGMDGLHVEMMANQELGGIISSAAVDLFEKPPNEMGSVLSSVRRHTAFLGFPAMRSVLEGHDFDLTDMKTAREGVTVYLCLPAGRMGTCNRWLRLFVNLALEAMEREAAKPSVPVLLCLDEFATLGRMEQVEVAAGQIAGFGCKLWPILQDLGQLKSLYKDRWQTFMGNAGILQCFGNNDVETLEYISRRLGKTTMIVKRSSELTHQERMKGATGKSEGPEVYDLITAEEASRFFARDDKLRRQLIIRPGKDPMVLSRVVYHEDAPFKGLFDTMP